MIVITLSGVYFMVYINSLKILNEIKEKRLNCENTSLDYKEVFHFKEQRDKLELIKDIVSFSNTRGGIIVFGVKDKSFEWIGLDERSDQLHDGQIESFLKKYIDQNIDFEIAPYEIEGRWFYLLTIQKNDHIIPFNKDGEYVRKKFIGDGASSNEHIFKKGDIYGRVKSCCSRVNDDPSFELIRNSNDSIVNNLSRFPKPYKKYIDRADSLDEIINTLSNENIRNVQINGLGGIGKTSFIRNFCDKLVNKNISLPFHPKFLIWITGKLDKFEPSGNIESLRDTEITFEEFLCVFADLFCLSKDVPIEKLENDVFSVLEKYESLIVLDNTETVNDPLILDFIKKVPLSTRVIFTTRQDLTTVYSRITLSGFNEDQFNQFVKNLLSEFNIGNSTKLYKKIEPSLADFQRLIKGSPLLATMIVYKFCKNFSIDYLLGELDKFVDGGDCYEKVMDFCFSQTFCSLSKTEKTILYLMSLSNVKEEGFSSHDLNYILDKDIDEIEISLSTLSIVSFCIPKNDVFYCQPLVKLFVSKMNMKEIIETKDIEKINSRYYKWSKAKTESGEYEWSYYVRVKAFDQNKKTAVLKLREIKSRFDYNQDYDSAIRDITSLIRINKNYAYLYFEKALFILKNGDDLSDVENCFISAMSLDKENDFYVCEYAFYLSSKKYDNENAIKYFKKALELNSENTSANFGIAVSLSKFYNNKPEFFEKSDIILKYFENSYFPQTFRTSRFKNCVSAFSHAKYLYDLKRYDQALEVCQKGLRFDPSFTNLQTLEGTIKSKIDPNYFSETKMKKIKSGIFASLSDEDAKALSELLYDE